MTRKLVLIGTGALMLVVASAFAGVALQPASKDLAKPAPPAAKGRLDVDVPKTAAATSSWIGVRLSPMPAPLAAHVGDKGLMIANIVKGSPSDAAGLQRYDVVLSFDGAPINAQEDLVQAINALKPGASAKLEIIRGGQKQSLTITPAQRADAGALEYKYPEADDTIDNSVTMRGHSLQLDPSGNWVWRDLGPQQLPDPLLDNWPTLRGFDWNLTDPFGGLDDPSNPQDWWLRMWQDRMGGSGGGINEMHVTLNNNGDALTVHRKSDGSFHVEKKTRDGKESAADYADENAFRSGDADAFEQFKSGAGASGPLNTRSQQWQRDWQNQIKDMIRNADELERRARDRANRMRDMLGDVRTGQSSGDKDEDRVVVPAHPQGAAGDAQVTKNADGSFKITLKRNGAKATYLFDNEDEFRKAEPELYARLKGTWK